MIMSITAACAAMLVLGVIYLATAQPWLGLRLERGPHGENVRLVSTAPQGPARHVLPGTVTTIHGNDGKILAIEPDDLVEEPDVFNSYDQIARFFDRQTAFADILRQPVVQLSVVNDAQEPLDAEIRPGRRPIGTLPPVFWVQLVSGLSGFVIGAWVWTMRRGDLSARMFALSGLGLMVSALPAAIYSTRELAIDGDLFARLGALNHLGTHLFGGAMVALFLSYPRPILHPAWLLLIPAVLATWLWADIARLLPDPTVGMYVPMVAEMALIVVLVALQWWLARHDPATKAVLRWLGLSVVIGAGAFVVTIAPPLLLGAEPRISQGYAFAFFLIIYGGIALGIRRYRLFELDAWAFRILFYALGAVLLLVLDVVLVYAVSLDRAPAFGLALLMVAFLYLPLRDWLRRRIMGRAVDHGALFRQTVDVALTPPGADQNARWAALLRQAFDPLRIEADEVAKVPQRPAIRDDGLMLVFPGIGDVGPVTLGYAHAGRKLFSRADETLALDLSSMLDHAIRSRKSREEGVAEERARIARDMHDNIGAKLLSALHSNVEGRKNAMIRDALTDFRVIINNAFGPDRPLGQTLAELRVETVERLEAAGIGLDWESTDDNVSSVSPAMVHTVCSIIREAVSNVIRHSEAKAVTIRIAYRQSCLSVLITDNGRGIDEGNDARGNGLANMRTRIDSLGGTFEIAAAGPGTRLAVTLSC